MHGIGVPVRNIRTHVLPFVLPGCILSSMAQSPLSMDTILATLHGMYKPPRSFLDWQNPLELLVATVLSAQCTDARVNIVTKTLFEKYKTPEDYANADILQLQQDIRSCGHYIHKATFINRTAQILLKKYNGRVPDTMEELIELPGVGRKTAAVVLHAAFDKREGIAVDTHVLRLSRRLGLTREKTPQRIEIDLMRQTLHEEWGNLNTLFISHGRAVCVARNRKCGQCVFQNACPSSRTKGKPDLAGIDPSVSLIHIKK
ncbi:MAG: DNA-(apurinic or apyrimidinic site) lyase/endonuclease [Candidatus Peribacteria bacterium]|nr:DNA-(apurinic or apyrimidinic site) lyase/endonuclease [Candidatus Peribacteria bacterium]